MKDMKDAKCFNCDDFLDCSEPDVIDDKFEKDLSILFKTLNNIDCITEDYVHDFLIFKDNAMLIIEKNGDWDEIVKEVLHINEIVKQDQLESLATTIEDLKKVERI
jgi:hypothetical protein